MDKIQFLVLANQDDLRNQVETLLQQNKNWQYRIVDNDEQAIDKFQQMSIDFVLYNSDVDTNTISKLKALFSFQKNEIVFIEFDGTNFASIENIVSATIDKQKVKTAFQYHDLNLS